MGCPTGCGRTQWSMQRHVSWVGSFMFTIPMRLMALVLFSTIFMSSVALLLKDSSSLSNHFPIAKRLDTLYYLGTLFTKTNLLIQPDLLYVSKIICTHIFLKGSTKIIELDNYKTTLKYCLDVYGHPFSAT